MKVFLAIAFTTLSANALAHHSRVTGENGEEETWMLEAG
jgi:hypothetical protein